MCVCVCVCVCTGLRVEWFNVLYKCNIKPFHEY